ncbi:MAG: class I SAM-dependent methyltransferase [Verrucomicrobiota bacterium]|nr:class I SAM-dependent methyltransferase [Verrucomicrobiota bacterium]
MWWQSNEIRAPQVEFLLSLIRSGEVYADVGCGVGTVASLAGRVARIHGFDISAQAIEIAREARVGLDVEFARAGAENLPMKDEHVAGCYAFEVLEHVWDPMAVLREMARITRPGGFILVSAPLAFSLDLRLDKRRAVRAVETVLAGARLALDRLSGQVCRHLEPRLDGEVFPDCDMITALAPAALARAVERMGCAVDFWDTMYMRAHRHGATTDLAFQRKTAHWFYRHFGDHLLLLAHRKR